MTVRSPGATAGYDQVNKRHDQTNVIVIETDCPPFRVTTRRGMSGAQVSEVNSAPAARKAYEFERAKEKVFCSPNAGLPLGPQHLFAIVQTTAQGRNALVAVGRDLPFDVGGNAIFAVAQHR